METVSTAALVGVIMALIKVIEYLIKQYSQKKSGSPSKAALHPEVVRQIRETYESVQIIEKDVSTMKSYDERNVLLIKEITENMKIVARTQEKTAELLDRIDRRLEVQHAVDSLKSIK